MIFDAKDNLNDIIVEELIGNRQTIKYLHERINERRTADVSLRAVYKTIDQLLEGGVILKAGKEVFLNQEWLNKLETKVLRHSSYFRLSDGESLVYHFQSLAHIDAFWKTFVERLDISDPKYPIFFYNPHDVWIHIPERFESERAYYEAFSKRSKYGFYVIGGDTLFDKAVRKTYRNDYLSIDLNPNLLPKRTDHITVLENYVITVSLPKQTAAKIDALFAGNGDKETENSLQKILSRPFRAKVKIEHNNTKAKKLRKKLSKNFFITRKLKESYTLF